MIYVNNIRVYIIKNNYPTIQPIEIIDSIRFYSLPDIAAMKLGAVSNRGNKKDFINIYFLLNEYPFREMIEFYKSKYNYFDIFHVLKSLTYFDDAENIEIPILLKKVTWKEIKSKIIYETSKYSKEII